MSSSNSSAWVVSLGLIVSGGACNPSGIALALHNACRQAIAEGVSQRDDPAIRLIGLHLAYLLSVDRILDADE